jgi:integrase/recombinase XerD
MIAAGLQALLQGFFTDRLLRQRQASAHTIASYRDTFRLLLRFAADQLGRAPSALHTEDLQPAFLGRFLEHLEQQRGNSSRTRNARLAAIHSFFRYVALAEPAHALLCQQVLAMPSKRHSRQPIAFLDEAEIAAVLAAPDLSTWIGRRDRALLAVAFQTGLRVSGADRAAARARRDGRGCAHPVRWQGAETTMHAARPRDGRRAGLLVATGPGQGTCPSLRQKRISPHVLRHSSAMRLRAHGVDQSVIALWLGHESVETTQVYLHADLRLKEQALARGEPLGVKPSRYRSPDSLLRFLESL